MVVPGKYAAPFAPHGIVLAERQLSGSAAWISLAKFPNAPRFSAQNLMALPFALTWGADRVA